MKYLLGIDIGTTSVKVVLISDRGEILAEASREHDLLTPEPGWAEECAFTWWENTQAAVQEIAGLRPREMGQLAGVGVSGMVPAIVLLDADFQVLRNSIQQNDARAEDQLDRVMAALDQEELYARTGGYSNLQHVLPRILWVKEQEPEIWGRVRYVMGSYDYINYKLTGACRVEINWAAESGLYDIRTGEWITDYLDRFGIDPAILPVVAPSTEIIGETVGTSGFGLPEGIPVIGGSADHVASALSAGLTVEGDLLIKFGGAGDVLYCTEEIVTSPALFFDYHVVPGKYLINGCMAASGSLVKWFTHDILGMDDLAVFREMDREAAKLPAASEGLIVLPYFLGEKTPLFDPQARGVLFGLTLSHTRGHIFRAILESVIYGFRHHLEVLEAGGCAVEGQVIATNGGAKSAFWCQIAADVLNREIVAYRHHPGSALGVAFVAGMGCGVFDDWQEIHKFLQTSESYVPNPANVAIYARAYPIYRGLYGQLRPSFGDLKGLYG
ncbi:MAG: FGGY-family carbohydrate kinase [Oscillospiraceae bacterium]|nr:FGGY-family carbohydrate kinase [Oscillospiraceae bacterium]